VVVTLEDSELARRLLLGHANDVEVVAPLSLRREIAERARQALALYAG
jgi:predicted DNA-binding transcriptional regulator YafY